MTATAVVGAGLIGQSWALVFARAGFQVRLHDAEAGALAAARRGIIARLRELEPYGLLPAAPEAVAGRVELVTDLAAAVAEADHVQENVTESVEAKAAVFTEFERHARPDAVLASSSSTIAASRFTANLANRARCLVAHPVNPPHLVPVVELVPAPWTDPEVVGRTHDLMVRAGQTPIRVNRELDGFVLNRLQAALLTEALRLAASGYVSVEDIDMTIKNGLGLRWAFMGPLETIDLNAPGGIEDYMRRYGPAFRAIVEEPVGEADPWGPAARQRVTDERRQLLAQDRLPERASWRDRRLIALLSHLREMTGSGGDAGESPDNPPT